MSNVYHDCKENKPLCHLPLIIDNRFNRPCVRNIQIMGASALEIKNGRRDPSKVAKQYDVFLINDNPGPNEERHGLPFVEKAAKILCDFLTKAGFDLSKVYVTSQVKCKTPSKRNPSAGEKESCKVHLVYEFEKYQPKMVILLGNPVLSLFNLNKEGGMKKIHGLLYKKQAKFLGETSPEFIVMPTYDPAAFLYREEPQLMRRVLDDYVTAYHVITSNNTEAKKHYQCKYKVCETVADVEEMCREIKENGIFAWDTESPNSEFWRVPIITAQFSVGVGRTWIIPFYKHDPEGLLWKLRPHWTNADRTKVHYLLSEIFSDVNITKCGHYAPYDMNVIRTQLGCEVKGWIWDSMVIHRLLHSDPPHDLEYLADISYGTGDYSAALHKITGKGKKLIATYDNVPDDILYPYGANDAELCYRLTADMLVQLQSKPNLWKYYQEEVAEALYNFADMMYVGQAIDVPVVETLIAELRLEINDIVTKAREICGPEFNPGSVDQVATQLIKLGHEEKIRDSSAASGYSTSKHILEEIDRREVPLVGYVVDYRNRTKMLSTYAENVINAVHTDGRGRFSYRPFMTAGGRASAKIVHQIPKIRKDKVDRGEPVYRDMFKEDDGFLYYYFDYSQIELYVFAILVGEDLLLEELKTGDPHRTAAATAMEVPLEMVSEFNRTEVGKRLGFGTIYGSEGDNIAKCVYEDPRTGEMKVIGDRAYQFVENYRRRYTKITAALDEIPEKARWNNNTVESIFGLERHLPMLNASDKGKRKAAEREAINFTAQSPANSVMMRTMNMIRNVLVENNIGLDIIRPINTVHDSGAYGVRKDHLEWFDQVVRVVGARPIPEMKDHCFKLKAGSGLNWTQAEIGAH